MGKVTINKFDLDWEVDVKVWLEGSTVFLSFLGEKFSFDTDDIFEDDVTEEDLIDCYFNKLEPTITACFNPEPSEKEMSDFEFYRMKL